mmetsp:Transcript_13969/g.28600  ORF Transcript_13969/g.28600 Transcript_13969/m.28600 type:complete len:81 (-) Transcript_13969:213-455(-)
MAVAMYPDGRTHALPFLYPADLVVNCHPRSVVLEGLGGDVGARVVGARVVGARVVGGRVVGEEPDLDIVTQDPPDIGAPR